MNLMKSYFPAIFLCMAYWSPGLVAGQDGLKHGLDSVFVEVYYISDANDGNDNASGDPIPEGTVTYRIYVDMAEGYKFQMMFSPPESPVEFMTTTKFYNNQHAGRYLGADMSDANLKRNIMALDSWLTINAASNEQYGVPKVYDQDGSKIGGSHNDGGSNSVEGGLLTNADPAAGIPLIEADGMIRLGEEPTVGPALFNIGKKELEALNEKENNGKISLRDGGIAILEGVKGPNELNQVLIAQLTTDGELSFKLTFQLLAPYGGGERFVAENADPIDFTHPSLIQRVPKPISIKGNPNEKP